MSRHTIVFGYRSLHLILTLLKTVITWEILHWVPTRRKEKKKKEEKIGFWSNLNITSLGRQGKGQNLSKLKGTWMVKKKKSNTQTKRWKDHRNDSANTIGVHAALGESHFHFCIGREGRREGGKDRARGCGGCGGRGGVTFGVGAAAVNISQATNTV